MREVIEIEIIAVISKEKTYGKNKTCYPFICDISINGQPNIEAKVVTFDSGIARSIGAAKKYEGVESEYRGDINYVLNKEIGEKNRSEPTAQASLTNKSSSSGYTADTRPYNLQQLSFARSYAKDLVVALLAKKELETSNIISIWNTLSDASVAWFERYTKSTHPETAPWGNLIIKNGLVDEVKKKKLEATYLRELWVRSLYDEDQFIKNLNDVLNGDDLPF